MSTKAVVPLKGGPIAETQPVVPKSIGAALVDLTVAFASGRTQSDEERKRWVQLCAGAVKGFDPRLVEDVLRSLVFHNPRNPFCPTPQDIYEACKARWGAWRAASLAKYELLRSPDGQRFDVPADLEIGFVRDWIENEIKYRFSLDRLVGMPDQCFARIPVEAFPTGAREEILSMRKDHADRERARRERDEREMAARGERAAGRHLPGASRKIFSAA
jgi:hypothetical protein